MRTIGPSVATESQPRPFVWWHLAYLVLQNALVVLGLAWLLAWLGNSSPFNLLTTFLIVVVVALTILGYTTSRTPPQHYQPASFTLHLTDTQLIVDYSDHQQALTWADIQKIEWQESYLPPAVVFVPIKNSRLYREIVRQQETEGYQAPRVIRLEVVGLDEKPRAILAELKKYWQAASVSRDES